MRPARHPENLFYFGATAIRPEAARTERFIRESVTAMACVGIGVTAWNAFTSNIPAIVTGFENEDVYGVLTNGYNLLASTVVAKGLYLVCGQAKKHREQARYNNKLLGILKVSDMNPYSKKPSDKT